MAVTRVVMPKLSEAMETGKVIKWLKKEGDRVQGGDILAEVETDKADVEMEAFGAGVLRKVLVPAGGQVPVGSLIAVIAEPDEDIAGVMAQAPAPVAAPAPAATPPAPAGTMPERPAPGAGASAQSTTAIRREPAPAPAAATAAPAGGGGAERPEAGQRVKASPLAKKIAAQAGVDLRLVSGSGPGGRVIRRDVEAA
ncbi:MAG: biotin/lipoyl-containing protein, partial [Candidatus Rokuibacteriota bacterium]